MIRGGVLHILKWGESRGGGVMTSGNIIKRIYIHTPRFFFLPSSQKLSFVCIGKVPRGIGLDSDSLGIAHLASHALDTYLCEIQ